jgi:pyruvate formate-lyase/glycerol dehydratase family glycyl radical enzyme
MYKGETETKSKTKYPTAERVVKLKDAILSEPMSIVADRSHIVTEYYKRTDGVPTPLRRAGAFKEFLENMSIKIFDDELVVGCLSDRMRGCQFFPEYSAKWLKNELGTLASRETEQRLISDEDVKILLSDIEYWDGRSLDEKAVALWKEQYGDRIQDANDSRAYIDFKGSLITRLHADYEKVLNKGLKGIIAEAQEELDNLKIDVYEDLNKRYFLKAVITSCEAVIILAKRYAALAKEMAEKEKDEKRKKELEEIADVCSRVPENPAQNFYEAVQSFWFIHLGILLEATASGVSPGRFDQYMFPFYQKDAEKGMTDERARELMGCLWLKFIQITRARSLDLAQVSHGTMYQNVTVGGETAQGKVAVNKISYLVLDVTEQVRLPQPTVSVRYNDRSPEDFILRACEVVSGGGGIPAFFMDKYAYSALPLFNIPLEHVRSWAPVGCIEAIIPNYSHGAFYWSFYSIGKCLELALNKGVDPRTGKQIGPETQDPRDFKSYDELFEAFKTQVIYLIETSKLANHSYHPLEASLVPVPFASGLLNDCIKNGKDLRDGGARYNLFLSSNPRGHITTTNSLYAIKKMVFEDKAIEMDKLLEALTANFAGHEELRRKLEDLPKYGNDIDAVDQVASDIFQLCEKGARDLGPGPFGDTITTTNQGIGLHYVFGGALGATPDGRKAYGPTADGSLSAYPGSDVKGPTALINSAAKISVSPCLSSLLNIKIHPGSVKGLDGLRKMMQLIKTYSDLGGYLIQFNIVDTATLIDAKEHPENYRDLTVRVAGFTAFWIDCASGIQDELIARTLHEF